MPKNFNRYDNIDYDVVEVNKHTLLLMFRDCEKYASLPTETLTYASLALSLLATVFFTESARGFWTISGETIQATFLVGGVAAAIMTLYKGILWYTNKGKFSPESLVKSLTPTTTVSPQIFLPAPKTAVIKPQKKIMTKTKQVVKSLRKD